MQDPYPGLLSVARELKRSRDGNDDERDNRDDGPSGSVATDTRPAKPRVCVICGESGVSGYFPVCCANRICADCVAQCPSDKYDHIFQIGNETQPICALCLRNVTNTASFVPWVPADKLPPLAATAPAVVGSDEDAWNFKLYHRCGQAFVVVGWEDCDILSGVCPKCQSRSVNLTGTAKGHSYELRDLLKLLAGFHTRASASSFASLATTFPDAWRTLRLTALLNAFHRNEEPDLLYWNEEAVAFLRLRAAEILKLLR